MFIKLGENIEISRIEDTDSCIPFVTQDILNEFKKTASQLKKIAPKAEDFLYFSAVMMHAAEASSLNEDGTVKLNIRGEPVKVGWDKTGGTWKWTTNDPNIKPYKNNNGDIFPEEELVKAYKKWVHKPLCIDHKSSSVDHVRGFIVDTYYDRNLKRVIALCALDKHNYPDLARKVATGYSNSVSMGTAVGRAICSDCSRVAKAESDFCDHMKRKSCYGEINIDLSPIELSIVVNGADPKAHIKHIIAAANTLNTYVENKSKELTKLANDSVFSASISLNSESNNSEHSTANFSIQAKTLKDLEEQLKIICEKLKEFEESSKDSNQDTNGLTSDNKKYDDHNHTIDSSGLAPPHERYASFSEENNDSIKELRQITASIDEKLNVMKNSLQKLANTSINTQEENMSGSNELHKKGYYQGSGGVNEPTPGQPKYTADQLNQKLRTDGDKHMVGDMDTGPVDGMHPGVESSGMSELDRKKMLARAEAEERAIRRTAIVNMAKQALEDKRAYFQGGGGVNEPTPGKTKYPVDSLSADLREDGDKHMLGQKPFPGVGSVEGLHPSPSSSGTPDELKRKEMLRRASLKARFVKVANNDGTQNLGKSAWQVFAGDKLLLTASVNELSGGNVGIMYDSIATKEFGSKLIEKIKVHGADSVRALVKKAQAAAPPPPPADAPADAPAAPTPPAATEAPALPTDEERALPSDKAEEFAEDTGKSGDPKRTALELSEKVRDLSSDLVEAVRALTGEQAEMGDVEEAEKSEAKRSEMGAAASNSFSLTTLNTLRKELNGALIQSMKESVAELRDHGQELEMIAGMYRAGAINSANREFVTSIVEDAIDEAKTSLADGFKLMTAFVKYARGTKAIVKRAQMENDTYDVSDIDNTESKLDEILENLQEENSFSLADDESYLDFENESEELMMSDDDNDADSGVTVNTAEEAAAVTKANPDAKVTMNTKAGRTALRAKLAADALGKMDDGELRDMSKADFSDMLDQAHRLTNGQTDLDVKPSNDLGRVETLEERNARMMDVATAPVKVRKEAEAIHKLISEGKLDVRDLDALVAEGLDKDAVSYYKKYFGQVDGGSEFASELVKEHVKAELEADLNGFKVKMARAYELAYDMVDRGLCASDRHAVSAQVDEIMKFNDESFDSLKRVVAKHAPILRKEAGRMPQVGMIGSGEIHASHTAEDDWSQLSAAFAKSSKRMF